MMSLSVWSHVLSMEGVVLGGGRGYTRRPQEKASARRGVDNFFGTGLLVESGLLLWPSG